MISRAQHCWVPRQETGRPFVDRIQLLDFTSTKKSEGSIYWVNVAWLGGNMASVSSFLSPEVPQSTAKVPKICELRFVAPFAWMLDVTVDSSSMFLLTPGNRGMDSGQIPARVC